MNNINNLISEELGKMSQLFHYQRGKVISEQTIDVGVDVGQMMRQLDATNTNEDAVLNIIKKCKKNQKRKIQFLLSRTTWFLYIVFISLFID